MKFLTAIFFTLFTATAWAQPLTVVRIGSPGAGAELFANGMAGRLKDAGWDTQLIGFNDCKGAEQWVKNNPGVPALIWAPSDDFVLAKYEPENPRSCPGLPLTRDTLVVQIWRAYHNICAMPDKGLQDLLKMDRPRIGMWAHPVQAKIVNRMLTSLDINYRLVQFPKMVEATQALVSGDLDFMVVTNELLVTRVGGQCFLSAAPPALATKMQDGSGNPRVSINEVTKKFNLPASGPAPVYIAINVDLPRLQKDVANVLNTAPEYSKIWTPAAVKSGILIGRTADEQWREVSEFLASFSKL